MRLKAAREKMGYSMGELAQALGIPKPTWQGYETGRRSCPYGVLRKVARIRRTDRQFFSTMPARIDARLDLEFPHGIPSEQENFTDENFS